MKKLFLLLLLYNFVEAMNGPYHEIGNKLRNEEINPSTKLKTLEQRIQETYAKAQKSINYLSTLPRHRDPDKRICKILPEANIEAQMLREIYHESQKTQLSNEEVQELRNKWFANASNVKRLHAIVFPLIEEDQPVKLKQNLNKPQHAMENSSNAKEDIEDIRKCIEKMYEPPNTNKVLPNTSNKAFNPINWFMKLIRYRN
jgi:hypothetical protein